MAKVARCCCCGQLLPPKIALPRIKQRIYDYVAAHPHGVDRRRIENYVYADDVNGGPDSEKTVAVHITLINREIESYGLRIVSSRGPGALYMLKALDSLPPKLTTRDVKIIQTDLRSLREFAAHYRVSVNTIWRIRHNNHTLCKI